LQWRKRKEKRNKESKYMRIKKTNLDAAGTLNGREK